MSEGDFLSTPDPGASYTPTPQTVFLGYDGSKNGDVPSDPASDARVFDQDGDGKIGNDEGFLGAIGGLYRNRL